VGQAAPDETIIPRVNMINKYPSLKNSYWLVLIFVNCGTSGGKSCPYISRYLRHYTRCLYFREQGHV